MYVLWEPLIPVSDVTYEYEVAYSVDPECSGDPVSLPDGYTLYYPRTSNHYIEVVGLMSGTCYVFGVRAYTDSPGEFSLIQGNTISNEGYYCSWLSRVTPSVSFIWIRITIEGNTIFNEGYIVDIFIFYYSEMISLKVVL